MYYIKQSTTISTLCYMTLFLDKTTGNKENLHYFKKIHLKKEIICNSHSPAVYPGHRRKRDLNTEAFKHQLLSFFMMIKIQSKKIGKLSISYLSSVQFESQLHLTLCDPMDCSTPGLPVHHWLPESTQTHVHELVMPSNHLILCRPLLLPPSIFPSIGVFSNESVLPIR